jgi:pimeloyl-ACP methyl ester carboxylesterase
MRNLVLVHGAWHGAWCWARLRPVLESRGNAVQTPTLTGLGELAYLATRDVGLETHVADIRQVLDESNGPVVLVAHSYAGIPATIVADRCRDRVSAVIYLDSGMPQNGQSANDVFPGADDAYTMSADRNGDGWLIPVPPDETFGIASEDDLAWVRANLTPQPLKSFRDTATLVSRQPVVPSGAIVCTINGTLDSAAAQSLAGVPTVPIHAGHDVMITNPQLVADALDDLLARMASFRG